MFVGSQARREAASKASVAAGLLGGAAGAGVSWWPGATHPTAIVLGVAVAVVAAPVLTLACDDWHMLEPPGGRWEQALSRVGPLLAAGSVFAMVLYLDVGYFLGLLYVVLAAGVTPLVEVPAVRLLLRVGRASHASAAAIAAGSIGLAALGVALTLVRPGGGPWSAVGTGIAVELVALVVLGLVLRPSHRRHDGIRRVGLLDDGL